MKRFQYYSKTSVEAFLPCRTPQQWIEQALNNQSILLIDHANCEKKAASTALSFLYRHYDKPDLADRMSKIAREELQHFEKVLAILNKQGISYAYLSPSRYARSLNKLVRQDPINRLIDQLIMGAFIEARSCERFACIAPFLDEPLSRFYTRLYEAEKRHFTIYLSFAEKFAGEKSIALKVAEFAAYERQLIESKDTQFRFHSGLLA
jgi:tRNA-(ms[2]io[6]A)-hydroxylase